jgi:hypothetical protein
MQQNIFNVFNDLDEVPEQVLRKRSPKSKNIIVAPVQDNPEQVLVLAEPTFQPEPEPESASVPEPVQEINKNVLLSEPIISIPVKALSSQLIGQALSVNGTHLYFNNTFKIWVRGETKDWTLAGFDGNFHTITNMASYLSFFTNLHKFNLQTNTFFISKSLPDGSYVEPMWEHKLNRDGIVWSLRIENVYGIELIQQLFILYVNECLLPDMSILNIISFNRVNNWIVIKLWISDKKVDIKKLLPGSIIGAYPTLCIKTKENKPEF